MTFVALKPGYPDFQLEWAPTTQPTDATQTYTDISTRLRGFEWSYGRSDELATFDTGSGYVILDNRDRALDPLNTAGAWYGNIKPRRMFRMQYKYAGVTYPGFVAYARGFPQTYPGGGKDNLVKVALVDAFAILEGFDLVVGFSRDEEATGVRVTAVLDAIGVPAALQDVDAGTADVAAVDVTAPGTSGLSHAKDVAAAEFGSLFCAKDGKVTFHNRHRRINQTSVWTFTDDPAGTLRYQPGFEPVFDDTYLWNYIYVSGAASGDTVGTATDSTSTDDYHTLTRTFSSPLADTTDRQALAEYLLLLYKQPQMRAPALPMQGALNPAALWPTLLDLEVSDRVTVRRFSTAAVPIVLTQNVEGVSHTVAPGGPWLTTVRTSPADTNTYWILEDATYGTIDSGNLVAP